MPFGLIRRSAAVLAATTVLITLATPTSAAQTPATAAQRPTAQSPAAPPSAASRPLPPGVAAAPFTTDRTQTLPPDFDERRAEDIRTEFRKLLERYPPGLARILRLDATLMTNPEYLAPYPAVGSFLQRHPEVPRYSGYFLNFVSDDGGNWQERRDPAFEMKRDVLQAWERTTAGFLVLLGFVTAVFALTRLVQYIVTHRRWLRGTQMQSDVQKRLLERFSSNEELLAFVQSPAGSQFLKNSPGVPEPAAPMSAPFSRILWSVQAGLVLACGGVGILFIRPYVMAEVGEILMVVGVLGVSLGIGFALAAMASWALSHRLGLFDATIASRARDRQSSGA